MAGLVERVRRRGRTRICWIDNIMAWTSLSGANLLPATQERGRWTTFTHSCSQLPRSDDGAM